MRRVLGAPLLLLAFASCSLLVDLSDLGGPVDGRADTVSALVVTASAGKVVQGQQTTITISVTPPPTAGSSVALSFTSLPVGVTVTTTPTQIVSGETSVQINLAASASTAQGVTNVDVGAVATGGASALTTFPLSVIGPPGFPDTTFGVGGAIRTTMGVLSDAAVQSTGKVVVCATQQATNATVSRFNTDGTPDPTFTTLTLPSPTQDCLVVHVCADDTIAMGDNTGSVWHLLADGTTDQAFGFHGITSLGDGPYAITDQLGALFVSSTTAKVYRLLPNGQLDTGFATNGDWSTDASLAITDLASAGGIALGVAHDMSLGNDLVPLRITSQNATVGVPVTTHDQKALAFALANADAGYYGIDPHDAAVSLVTFSTFGSSFASLSEVDFVVDAGVVPVGGAFDANQVLICGQVGSVGVAFHVDPVQGTLDTTFGNAAPFASIDFGGNGALTRCYVAGGELVMIGFENAGQFMAARFWL